MSALIRLTQIPLDIHAPISSLKEAAAGRLGVPVDELAGMRVLRRAIDARRGRVRFLYTAAAEVSDDAAASLAARGYELYEEPVRKPLRYGAKSMTGRPVVVGAGPCGLFAALTLAEHGYAPVLIERGQPMERRERDMAALSERGILDPESNALFGEGGAGAFSDGKLTTRIKDPKVADVLRTLVRAGAPQEIEYIAKPHLGTERIRRIFARLRELCVEHGCQVFFGAKLTELEIRQSAVTAAVWEQGGQRTRFETGALILAAGHSARDTAAALMGAGVPMEPKSFAVGVRAEHLREDIDRALYGSFAGDPVLGAAEYALKARSGCRGVYTFCMCPGGLVVCSASEPEHMAVNGMSYGPRDGVNSNAAVVVTVAPSDFPAAGPLGGIELQRRIERAAYAAAGGYGAPVQLLGDFAAGRASTGFGAIRPTYTPYTVFSDLNAPLPEPVRRGIREGFAAFGRQLSGYDRPDTVLIGFETRTSAPFRMVRGDGGESIGVSGLYPSGEGAGYAGGIVSAAVDGMRQAERLMERFAAPRD